MTLGIQYGQITVGAEFLRIGLDNNKKGLFVGKVGPFEETYEATTKMVHKGGPEATAKALGYRHVLYCVNHNPGSQWLLKRVS